MEDNVKVVLKWEGWLWTGFVWLRIDFFRVLSETRL
jgi:hypothetical protein